MRPRRMDGTRPAGSPQGVQPRPAAPVQRPMSQPRPSMGSRVAAARQEAYREPYQPPNRQQYAATGQARAAMPQQRGQAQPQPLAASKKARRRGGGWKVALQFVIGLVVIALVAGAIVWLYVRYYQ